MVLDWHGLAVGFHVGGAEGRSVLAGLTRA
jgi:hypothetical protein